MFRAQLKILFTLLALGFLGCIIFGTYYLYKKEFQRDSTAKEQIEKRQQGPPPDPGKNKYAQAIGLLKTGDLNAAKALLIELVRHYKESSKYSDAKRIIGEINVDALLEPKVGPGKKEYVVQRGDSLSLIASRNQTTIDCIQRSNGMLNTNLQPGDRLIVFPLDFSMVIDVEVNTLTLMKNIRSEDGEITGERFFKEYPVLKSRLPANVRVPFETTLGEKAAWEGSKRVNFGSSGYLAAEKWLQLKKGGVIISGRDPEKGASEEELPLGIFLDPFDMEELFTLVRGSIAIKVVR